MNWNFKKSKSIDYSQIIDDLHENLEDYNPTKKRRALIVFDGKIADMESNKRLGPTVTELFLRRRQYFTRFYITILFQSD